MKVYNMTQKNEKPMVRAGYYIPLELKEALENDAHKQRRSASYVLTEIAYAHYATLDLGHKGNPGASSSK